MILSPKNSWLLDTLEPFVVATNENLSHFDLEPFGMRIAEDARIDPLRLRSKTFLDLLKRLDDVTFGPEGMPMPRWIFVDGAELTGGIVGLGRTSDHVPDEVRALLRVPDDYDGLVPYSMFIAIPTHERGVWMGHNLASLRAAVDDQRLVGLGGLTKSTGLAVFRTQTQIGATQWASLGLHVHTRLGPLELMTAWTPAHSEPQSLTYRVRITPEGLQNLARDPAASIVRPPTTQWIDSGDDLAMQAMQSAIEVGRRFCITAKPQPGTDGQRVPVAELRA